MAICHVCVCAAEYGVGVVEEFSWLEEVANLVRSPAPPRGMGDDAALIDFGSGARFAIATDTMVEGTHFRLDWSNPANIGWKAVMVNVSDLAACGVTTSQILVSVTVPPNWGDHQASELMFGCWSAAREIGAEIVGGDTVTGPVCTVTVTAVGPVQTRFVTRSGAGVGDLIAVSGPLGAAAGALSLLDDGHTEPDLTSPHRTPRGRYDLATTVAEYATSAIDISDGLTSELRHIAKASKVGVMIDAESVPISPIARTAAQKVGGDAFALALSGGDDYEILATFTERVPSGWIQIGTVTAAGLVLVYADGRSDELPQGGWTHTR